MGDVFSALESIAAARRSDPLAPVTVIVPSHAGGLQLRRRLAELGPFAAVFFEMLPRVAELLAAGDLAAAGRAPLARPIGDYVAEQVARESQGPLARVGERPGYARALRRIFRRLRRGGIRQSQEAGWAHGGQVVEVLRLYDRFREKTARFYDDEDLLEATAASVRASKAGPAQELGSVYVVPPGAQSAGAAELLEALRERGQQHIVLDEPVCAPEARFVLAPDPASEAREVAREVVSWLESGVALHELAVLHGADQSYRRLLREQFAAAGVPVVPLPGVPLTETRAGRGVLSLAQLPEREFSRNGAMEFLSLAPLRGRLPTAEGTIGAMPAAWDRISREAGITRGAMRWESTLTALIRDREASIAHHEVDEDEARARVATYERDQARDLREVMAALIGRLEPLRETLPADAFIEKFTKIVDEYFDPAANALEDVRDEISQLGTVGAVGGEFRLVTFAEALRANLEAAFVRPASLGNGIVVADYRTAAGMRFERMVLYGACEGALPAGPGSDALIEDSVWSALREGHPFIEDAALRVQRAEDAVDRAVAAAGEGEVVWSAPRHEPGGTREYYPSPLMRRAAAARDPSIRTASELRGHAAADGWLRRGESPLAAAVRGPVVLPAEAALRWAIGRRRRGEWLDPQDGHWPAVSMIRARRSRRFTEWDGNLAALGDDSWLELQRKVSPTSLEKYAVCGFQYFAQALLRLRAVEEPEEREMMDAAERGTLIHAVLQRFCTTQLERGRPEPNEPWTQDDAALLMEYTEEALADAERRGLTGLDVFAGHEARTIKADLRRFLEEDSLFRRWTGGVPVKLEAAIPETEVAGVRLRGQVDRVDATPDGKRAWVIDYKSGRIKDYEQIKADNPLAGGKRLQLPAYLAAAPEGAEARAFYWFITQRGGFDKIGYEPSPAQAGAFERTLTAILAGIRAGSFPAVPGDDEEFYGTFNNCRYCDYDRICSRRRDLELGAKRDDAGVRPWRAVEAAAMGGEPA